MRPLAKNSRLRIYALLLAVLLTPFAQAEVVPSDVAQELSHVAVQTAEITPAQAIENSKQRLVLKIRDGSEFTFLSEPPSEAAAMSFAELSEFEQAKFFKIRSEFLKLAVPVLARAKLSLGVGSVIKRALKQLSFGRNRNKNPLEELAKDALPDLQENPASISAQGRKALKKLLNGIDNLLWKNAKEVVSRNEFVARISLGFQLQGGFLKYVFGGTTSYVYRIGYNSDLKSLVYDIYRESEKLEYAYFVPFSVGIVPKIGIGLYTNTEEGRTFEGKTLYPTAAPLYASKGNGYFESGITSGWLAFPPVIGEFYAYTSRTIARESVLRRVFRSSSRGTPVEEFAETVSQLAEKIERRDLRDLSQCEIRLREDVQ